MNEIIDILMNRDNISREDAESIVISCKEELEYVVNNGGSYDEAVEVIKYWLGLEPDYMDILLGEL